MTPDCRASRAATQATRSFGRRSVLLRSLVEIKSVHTPGAQRSMKQDQGGEWLRYKELSIVRRSSGSRRVTPWRSNSSSSDTAIRRVVASAWRASQSLKGCGRRASTRIASSTAPGSSTTSAAMCTRAAARTAAPISRGPRPSSARRAASETRKGRSANSTGPDRPLGPRCRAARELSAGVGACRVRR